MSRLAILNPWLASFLAAATLYGCEVPEAFHLTGDGNVAPLGSGGDTAGTGGVAVASGGMVGSGGVVGSGGIIGAGGADGTGGAAAPAGRGGTTGGDGGTTGGGGSTTGGRGGTTGGRGGSTGGRGGSTGGRGGSSTGAAGGATSQKILSIDFGVGGQGAPAMAATDTAGVKPARRWNSAVGASGTLSTTLVFADASAATGAMVTWMSPAAAPNTGVYAVGLTDATGDGHLMNGYLDPGMAPAYTATITVSGLPAPLRTSGYDVYVYYMAQLTARVTRSHTLTIGTKSFTVSQTGPSPTRFTAHLLTPDRGTTGDYVLFTNVTGSTFTLKAAAVSATDGAMRAPVNGIQIVWPSGS